MPWHRVLFSPAAYRAVSKGKALHVETHLDRILVRTRADLAVRMAGVDRPALERRAADHRPRGFAAALKAAAQTRTAVIA